MVELDLSAVESFIGIHFETKITSSTCGSEEAQPISVRDSLK